MAITYTVAIDRNSDGDFSDANEDITNDVLELSWRLGLENPYDSMAAPSWARVTLLNLGREYSPEANNLLPGTPLRIQSNDGTTTRTHFTGVIDHITPSAGDQGAATAVIHAHGPENALALNQFHIPPAQQTTADGVIAAILDQVILRRAVLDGYCIVGVSGYNTIGTHKLFGSNHSRSLETGQSVFATVGDTWNDSISAADAIRELAASERGRFFPARDGTLTFINRHHNLLNTTVSAAFDDDMAGLDYVYGHGLANHVQVTMTPREIGAAGTVLWSLSGTQSLPAGSIRRVTARFRDADDNPVAALDLIPPLAGFDYTATTSGATPATDSVRIALVETGAESAVLEIHNESSQSVTLDTLQVRGTPLSRADSLTLQKRDNTSITFYGLHPLALNLPAVTSLDDADQIARYELARRKDPRGVVRTLQTDTRHHPAAALALTLFDRITVTETQTHHSGDYLIIAEAHQVDRGGTRHRVTWTLEPADSDIFFIIGTHKPDGSRVLAY